MENKEISKLFADMIAMSDRKPFLDRDDERTRSGVLFIGTLDRDAMLEAMARLHCRSVGFGTYECIDVTKENITVDYCLSPEIQRLRNDGIETIGCCCGHGRLQGYIQVDPKFVETMKQNGYKQLPLDKFGNGHWCFKPKTSLPKPIADKLDELNGVSND